MANIRLDNYKLLGTRGFRAGSVLTGALFRVRIEATHLTSGRSFSFVQEFRMPTVVPTRAQIVARLTRIASNRADDIKRALEERARPDTISRDSVNRFLISRGYMDGVTVTDIMDLPQVP